MDEYVYISCEPFYGCYRIKVSLPERFHKVDKRRHRGYKTWYARRKARFTHAVKTRLDDVWWNSLSAKVRSELYARYRHEVSRDDFEAFIKERRWRFVGFEGGTCRRYRTVKSAGDIKM